jgi:hypothetical protein
LGDSITEGYAHGFLPSDGTFTIIEVPSNPSESRDPDFLKYFKSPVLVVYELGYIIQEWAFHLADEVLERAGSAELTPERQPFVPCLSCSGFYFPAPHGDAFSAWVAPGLHRLKECLLKAKGTMHARTDCEERPHRSPSRSFSQYHHGDHRAV